MFTGEEELSCILLTKTRLKTGSLWRVGRCRNCIRCIYKVMIKEIEIKQVFFFKCTEVKTKY